MKINHLQWYVNKIRIPVHLLDVSELCWRVRGWNFTHLSLFFWVENEGKFILGWITTFSIHVILIHTRITECSVHKDVEHWALNPNISIVPLSHLCVIPLSSQKQHYFPWAASHSTHVHLSVFVLGVQFLDWGTNKRSYLYLRLVLSMSSLLDLRRRPRWRWSSSTPAHQPVIAAGLRAAKPPIQSRPPRVHSAWRPTSWSCVIAPSCMLACVRVREFAATAPLSPVPFHSYKPRSVFIDAVYFVLYQINNKTQTRPEEQRRKVVS